MTQLRDKLENSPPISIVWEQWVNWVNRHNKSQNNSVFNAPIPAGYNINGFDMPILERYCLKYGPKEKDRNNEGVYKQKLVNGVNNFDLFQHAWFWTENIADEEVKDRLRLAENLKRWLGFPEESIENAHDALQDVKDTAEIIISLFKLQRYLTTTDETTGKPKIQMKGLFSR